MAILTNNEARLFWGPSIPGHAAPRWLPGENRLDPKYWATASRNADVKRWMKLGWIEVDLEKELPDPTVPPSPEELAEFTDKELRAALKASSNVPVQWHPALEAEIAKRADALKSKVEATTSTNPSGSQKSLEGLPLEAALPLVAAETDANTLEEWARGDKREEVTQAIDKRLADLALAAGSGSGEGA